jgi:hypothetical protein
MSCPKTPDPPTPLLSDNSSLANVTITLGSLDTSVSNSNVGNTADISNFVNGTAAGLTCFIHPDTTFVGWPYGDGGLNAVPTTTDGGAGGGGGGAQTSSPAPSPSDSDNGSASGINAVGAIAWVLMGSLLGVGIVL